MFYMFFSFLFPYTTGEYAVVFRQESQAEKDVGIRPELQAGQVHERAVQAAEVRHGRGRPLRHPPPAQADGHLRRVLSKGPSAHVCHRHCSQGIR